MARIVFEGEEMKTVLFIDACVRGGQSRTRRLADVFLKELCSVRNDLQIETVNLNERGLMPLNERTLREREESSSDFGNPVFKEARQFKEADFLVIAAPFWEGTFPAALHTYLEHVCVTGLTFSVSDTGYKGHCRAERAVFITTRGGIYESGEAVKDNHAPGFLSTVLTMLGVPQLYVEAAEGLDIIGCDVERELRQAEERLCGLAVRLAGEI